MKFRISAKDFMIFCVYCLLLLYLCCIAVLNFSSFINEGEFYGLWPFEAFTSKYLFVTLFMFAVSLIIIFTSVSSYIFDKEKGKGLGLKIGDKDGGGYARWATDKEIKADSGMARVDPKANTLEAAGIPIINNGKEIWVDNGEYHNLVIGSTGSGKTQTVVKPMVNLLAKKGESMIITDPKGEIYKYAATALKERGYKIIVLNFREPNHGNAWNPLTLPYRYFKSGNTDKSTELLDDVALNILYDQSKKGGDSDFWEKSAADYFSGLALGLFYDAQEKEVNLNSINFMSSIGEERYATSTYIKEYFNLKGQESSPYIFASNTINAPNETKGGILSTFRQKIRLFSSRESLSEMLAYSDFDMQSIGREKTAVFMIIHDEKKTYHSLMTIFIKQCYETLIDVAQESGGKLPFRTNFILDEFANMPPLKDVDSMVSAARSRDIRFTFIIQNFAQLNDVYGKEVGEIIKGNCGNLVYLISTELAALEEISKMCGEVKSKEKDKTASTPLVTVSDLQKLKLFEAIIIRLRKNPFKTKLEPDFKMNWGMNREAAEYPNREIKKIELFDVKKFVTEEKRKQMMNNLENKDNSMGNPFSNNFGNPFMPGGMGGGSPFGMGGTSQASRSQPLGGGLFGNSSMFDKPINNQGAMMNSSLGNNSMFDKPLNSLSDMDIDAMMKDIDRRLKELDEEEARQKAEAEKDKIEQDKKIQSTDSSLPELKENIVSNFESPFMKKQDEVPGEEKISKEMEEAIGFNFGDIFKAPIETLEEKKEEVLVPPKEIQKEEKIEDVMPVEEQNAEVIKPKINVDADSIIVNDNVITDDEFFDDFFGE